jgi:hypothetical protein
MREINAEFGFVSGRATAGRACGNPFALLERLFVVYSARPRLFGAHRLPVRARRGFR